MVGLIVVIRKLYILIKQSLSLTHILFPGVHHVLAPVPVLISLAQKNICERNVKWIQLLIVLMEVSYYRTTVS